MSRSGSSYLVVRPELIALSLLESLQHSLAICKACSSSALWLGLHCKTVMSLQRLACSPTREPAVFHMSCSTGILSSKGLRPIPNRTHSSPPSLHSFPFPLASPTQRQTSSRSSACAVRRRGSLCRTMLGFCSRASEWRPPSATPSTSSRPRHWLLSGGRSRRGRQVRSLKVLWRLGSAVQDL